MAKGMWQHLVDEQTHGLDDHALPEQSVHGRGKGWFAALTFQLEKSFQEDAHQGHGPDESQEHLRRCMRLFSLFNETGESRYLDLSNDFLRLSMQAAR